MTSNAAMLENSGLDKEYLSRRSRYSYPRYRMSIRLNEIINAIDSFNKGKNFSMLEIGCGDGLLLGALKQHYMEASFCGVEPSKLLSDNIADKSIRVINATVEALEWKENAPDFVLIAAVIEHLKDPKLALMKIKNLMNKNSVLIITYPNPVWDRINSLIVNNGHIQRFTAGRMSGLLNECGFSIKEAYGFMANPFFNAPVFNKTIEFTMKSLNLDAALFNRFVLAVPNA